MLRLFRWNNLVNIRGSDEFAMYSKKGLKWTFFDMLSCFILFSKSSNIIARVVKKTVVGPVWFEYWRQNKRKRRVSMDWKKGLKLTYFAMLFCSFEKNTSNSQRSWKRQVVSPLSFEYSGQMKRNWWFPMDSKNNLKWTHCFAMLFYSFRKTRGILTRVERKELLALCRSNFQVKLRGNDEFQWIPKTV